MFEIKITRIDDNKVFPIIEVKDDDTVNIIRDGKEGRALRVHLGKNFYGITYPGRMPKAGLK